MWYVILFLLIGVYLTLNYILPSGGLIESYLIRPLIWIGLGAITLYFAREEGIKILKFKKVRKWYLGKTPIHAGLLLGGFHVSLLIIVGVLFGFGKSPYSFTPLFITINIFFIGSLLFGTEIARSYLVKKTTKSKKKNATLWILFFTLIFLIIKISPNDFGLLDFSEPVKTLEFLGSVFVVTLSINLLATYLSYLGGATASMGYMGVLLAFEWFSPILPNPHWTILALVGTIGPAIGFVVLQDSIKTSFEKPKRQPRTAASNHGWTLIAIFTVIIVFFSYGYLGVEPTVIYSGSMRPEFQVGDVVLVDEIEIEDIKEGDIIQFIRDDVKTLHRVVEIQEGEDETSFIVKGDANDDPDPEPIVEQQVLGKAVFTLPKLGWIQIFINEVFRGLASPF